MRFTVALTLVFTAGAASAQFVTPDAYGWSRSDSNTTYYEWEDFASLCEVSPDFGSMPASVDGVFPSLCEVGEGGAFITSTGNIYSFGGIVAFEVDIPADGAPGDTVSVLVQIQTQGTELDPASLVVEGIAPSQVDELSRIDLGSGAFGGFLVETAYLIENVPYSNPLFLEFSAEFSSMSLDSLSVDTVSRSAECVADVNGDGFANPADFNAWVLAFNTQGPGCDQNGNGICEPADFNAWVLNFNTGC